MSNPTGKGGFQERPQDINRTGLNRRENSWQETVKKITNMTRDELIEMVGKRTRMARLLKELPPHLPVKDALVLISIIHYGREPNARMFNALTNREEGKPPQSVELTGKDGKDLFDPENMKPSEIAERVAALLKGKDANGG